MTVKNQILKGALAGAFILASTSAVAAMGDSKGKEKCHGVSKKGGNDCGTASHGCAGKAAADYDAKEWKYVKEGTCKKMQADMKKNMKKHSKGAHGMKGHKSHK
jgi:uncharacterized membrane protein